MYRSKYHNRKVTTPDGVFDSKREHKRWTELKALEASGTITDLQRQIAYELIPSQKIDGRVIERAVKYIADFSYKVDGVLIVEDSKGKKTPEYIIKRKLMLERYGIKIREV